MAEDALQRYEVELGLRAPETAPLADTAKNLGPATERRPLQHRRHGTGGRAERYGEHRRHHPGGGAGHRVDPGNRQRRGHRGTEHEYYQQCQRALSVVSGAVKSTGGGCPSDGEDGPRSRSETGLIRPGSGLRASACIRRRHRDIDVGNGQLRPARRIGRGPRRRIKAVLQPNARSPSLGDSGIALKARGRRREQLRLAPHSASWKMTPRLRRSPALTRLTPWRTVTR